MMNESKAEPRARWNRGHRWPGPYLTRHGIAALILMVLLAVTALGGLGARNVIDDQERRMLDQRATELAAFLSSSVIGFRSSLIAVGMVAASQGNNSAVLTKVAGTALSSGSTITVVQRTTGGWQRIAGIGDGQSSAGEVTGQERKVAERALTSADLVTEVDSDPTTRLLFGVKVDAANPTVVLREQAIAPTRPAPTSENSPYRDLNVALYASAAAQPQSLLLISGEQPTSGSQLVRRPVPVGSDTWLVVAAPRGVLVGSFAANFPWTLTIVGVLLSIAIAALIEVLTRRRTYAYNLVQQRTSTLQQAQAAAEGANLAKSEFLSRMSHELRTPLNAVLGFSQVLEMDELTPDQRESVAQISKGGRHLLNLINEVLDISHIESGKLSFSPEPVLVSELISETVDLMRPLARDRSLHLLRPEGHTCEHHIFTDRQRIKQILLNLLSNAIKYNRQGGTVSINCDVVSDCHLRIRVNDTGPGIHASQLPLLFVPFERLGAEQTTVEGTGIGLALSQKLAEAMGGTLGVESVVGRGSTFWVEFPLVEGPIDRYERLHQPAEEPEPPEASPTRVKILYIEDNLSNLKLVERVLAQRPHVELIAAMQGQLGVELAREHQPVLVLLDLNLADLPGEDVLRRLRDDPGTSRIPVVIVSADAMPRHAQRLIAAGAASYITKPIDVQEILKVIDDALAALDPT